MSKALHFAGSSMVALLAGSLLALALTELPSAAQPSDAIKAPGETVLAMLHAAGSQVYECKPGVAGALVWQFREPIATLLENGMTVGRHYAGPTWELVDGSAVVARTVAHASGEGPGDIPLLKLRAISSRGAGRLNGVHTIQRLSTRGGVAEGACDKAGALLSVPYSADYAFLKRPAD